MSENTTLIGSKYGRLTVLEETKIKQKNRQRAACRCMCECGNEVTVRKDGLQGGTVRSCGCLKKERDRQNLTANHSHKMSGTRLYHTWTQMKGRCHNSGNESFDRYGGRGITVCEEWRNSFEPFWKWSMDNGYEKDLSIDRINNDIGYSPDNCRWTTNKVQSRNRRSNIKVVHEGKEMTLIELSENVDLNYGTLAERYNKGDRGEWLVRGIREGKEEARGSKQHLSKLKEDDVIEIKRLLKTDMKRVDIAGKFNISPSTISAIAKNRVWKHI